MIWASPKHNKSLIIKRFIELIIIGVGVKKPDFFLIMGERGEWGCHRKLIILYGGCKAVFIIQVFHLIIG